MGTLRFILGQPGSGKTTRVIEEITALLRAEPLGEPIWLLVPDQATLLYERLIACAPASSGYLRLRVVTFRELTERLLADGGGSSIPEVTPLGRRILIGRLLRRLQPELGFYSATARQPGLAAKLDDAFTEIERSGRNLDDLLFIAGDVEAMSPQSSLPAKLRDLHKLIIEYERILGTDRLDQHRRFAHALKAAERSIRLGHTRLFVDDFYDFTSTERALLVQLARYTAGTTVALTVDPANVSVLVGKEPLDDHALLRSSSLAFRRLHHAAATSGVAIDIDRLTSLPRFASSDLLHLAKQFGEARAGKLRGEGTVRFVECATLQQEVDAAARQIREWVSGGLRLRDIVVLSRDISEYQRAIESSFREHGLPCFIDRQVPASPHPLIRTVRAIVQLVLTDYRHDAVADLIKSGLSGFDADSAALLENYLLAHRIRGTETWSTEWAYVRSRRESDEFDTRQAGEIERINAFRQRVIVATKELHDAHTPRNAQQWSHALCVALDALDVPRTLAAEIQRLGENGALEAAARDQEVWNEFTELLDQLCAVLAEEALPLREFAEVLDVALERFTLTITPPTIDQVLVGSVDRTRTANVKACIVLGLSEGMFPKRSEDVAALNDDDRRYLDERQFELRTDSRRALLDEQTLAYLAFTRPSTYLTVMRPTVNAEGRPVRSSLFWSQATRVFEVPSVTSSDASTEIQTLSTPSQLADTIIAWANVPQATATAAALQLTQWLIHSTDPRSIAARTALQRAITYDNAATLSRAISLRLFPEPVKMSATRFETFAACPYKHFAQYTLGLRIRDEADLTRLDLGTVYHRVLENLIGQTIRDRRDFAEPIPQAAEQIRALSEQAAGELRSEFMLTPGRNRHLLESVQNTIEHVVETQRHTAAAGSFRPVQTEFPFGITDKAPPLQLTTPQGRTIHLRGKIDRIDTFTTDSNIAASVVDYKLGEHKADYVRIYNGLSLQLVTYLLVIDALGESIAGKPMTPVAAFYVKLLRTIESIPHPDDRPDPSEPAYFLRNNKARGVIDERFAAMLDTGDTALSVKRIPNAHPQQRGDVLEPDAFDALLRWTRGKLGALADQIIDGRIDVRPYKLKTQTPCPHCDFRPVCRLDLAFNRYLQITDVAAQSLDRIVKGDA